MILFKKRFPVINTNIVPYSYLLHNNKYIYFILTLYNDKGNM